MPPPDSHTFFASLVTLFRKGVRYSTVIDVGCADGNLFLTLMAANLVPGAVPLNIDPNPIYEDSLKAIRDTVGGHYRICAITDREGEVELTMSAHPYWTSLRPPDDPYWERVNRLSAEKSLVPATTLDALSVQLALQPPFLLKLDVQGAESEVLRGAEQLLKQTQVVICEADMDDFQAVNRIMLERDFILFDVTDLKRVGDGFLGWFYPVYISRSLDSLRPRSFWDSDRNEAIIQDQIARRTAILKANAEMLARIRNPQAAAPAKPQVPAAGRNAPCPCGSGRKYKHCCGAYAQSGAKPSPPR
jgi:FkbM family methyltransferase